MKRRSLNKLAVRTLCENEVLAKMREPTKAPNGPSLSNMPLGLRKMLHDQHSIHTAGLA